MGPYCQFCDRRCFVLRRLPNNDEVYMATCQEGMWRDRKVFGLDHKMAINPLDKYDDDWRMGLIVFVLSLPALAIIIIARVIW